METNALMLAFHSYAQLLRNHQQSLSYETTGANYSWTVCPFTYNREGGSIADSLAAARLAGSGSTAPAALRTTTARADL